MVSSSMLTDRLLEVTIFALLGAALVPVALESFMNLSASGIALASLFGSVLGIVLAVFVFKGIFGNLRSGR